MDINVSPPPKNRKIDLRTNMNKCIQCEKEFEAKRTDQKFCSASCRLKCFRETDNFETGKNETSNETSKSVKKEPLKLEGKELDDYLAKTPLRVLEAEGRWLPNWKRSGVKSKQHALSDLLEIMKQTKSDFNFMGHTK